MSAFKKRAKEDLSLKEEIEKKVRTDEHGGHTDEINIQMEDRYGSDLMGDEEDRVYLASLTQREREEILFEREEQRQKIRERAELQKRAEGRDRSAALQKVFEANRIVAKSYDDDDVVLPATSVKESAVKEAPILLSDVINSQLRRKTLETWIYRSFFKTAVIGCFVRFAISNETGPTSGPAYRMARIMAVEETNDSYTFGNSQVTTKYRLKLDFGQKKFVASLRYVSNDDLSQWELNHWLESVHKADSRRIGINDLLTAAANINYYSGLPTDEQEMSKILALKKSLNVLTVVPARERATLIRNRDEAQLRGDLEQMKELNEKLEVLDQSRDLKPAVKKQERAQNDRARDVRSSELSSSQGSSSSTALDPFARKKTRSTFSGLAEPEAPLTDPENTDSTPADQQKPSEAAELSAKDVMKMEEEAYLKAYLGNGDDLDDLDVEIPDSIKAKSLLRSE